jgi:hypothetical protein
MRPAAGRWTLCCMTGPPHTWDPRCPPPRGLVRPVPVDPRGLHGPTRGQATGPRWRQTSAGLYVPAAVDGARPEQRILEQSMRLPPEGAVTGWAACRLHGSTFLDGLRPDGRTLIPVPLSVGPRARLRRDPRVTLNRDRLSAQETTTRLGISCTTVHRALFDAMRFSVDVREAVVAMDMMAAAELTSIRRMRNYSAGRSRWNGIRMVRAALGLASEDSRSPNETRMRLVWELDAGLPRPGVNRSIYTRHGRFLATVDLLDSEAGLVGEYDGADHRGAVRHAHDVEREERLRRVRLEVCRVTSLHLGDTRRLVERLHSARSRALWLPPSERAWTTKDPSAGEPELTLDEVLDHREWLAAVHAAYESGDSPQAGSKPIARAASARSWSG